MLAQFQTDSLPRLSCVSRLEYAIAGMGHHASHCMFTGADIHDVGIAFCNCDRPDGSRLEIAIGDIPPTDSHVISLPQTATRRAHVISLWIADDSGAGH